MIIDQYPPCMREIGPGRYQCTIEGWEIETTVLPIVCQCAHRETMDSIGRPVLDRGPGTELDKLLRLLRIRESGCCDCGKLKRRMDYMGPDWCAAHREIIVDGMEAAARKRKHLKLLFTRFAARRLVGLAVRRSRKYYGGFPAIATRNLIYHCCPLKENRTWLDNIAALRRRWHVFNGRKIIAIAIDDRTHDPVYVRRMLDLLLGDAEHLVIENDPVLRETASLPLLLEEIQNTRPDEASFFGHTKGIATLETTDHKMRDEDRIKGAELWRNTMYRSLLDRADECIEKLESYSAVGTTQMIAPDGLSFAYPSGLKLYTWMFAGTFFWFRNDAVFTNPRWRNVQRDRYGAEAWIGNLLPPAEVYSVYQPWDPEKFPVGSPYNPGYYNDQ